VQRHTGVAVDYWTKAALDAKLETAEGQRIAASFFEEEDAVAIAERMLRAGSPLRSGEDFLSAEGAIAEGLARADPDHEWVIHRAARGLPDPGPTPGAVLRLSFASAEVVVHADLVPRHGSPAARPGVTLQLDDSPEGRRARRWLEDLMRSGGRLALGKGTKVSLSDIPPPFGDMLTEPLEGEMDLRAVAEPAPFYGRLTAGPVGDTATVDVDLLPADPPEDWDAALQGRIGGLDVTLRFRWFVHEGQGESRLTFHYQPSGAPHAVEAEALRWMCAAHREGVVRLEDRNGERPSVEVVNSEAPMPAWLELWAQLHEDLAALESAAGAPAPQAPDEVTVGEVDGIATVAAMVRSRRYPGDVRDFTLTYRPGAQTTPGIGRILKDVRTERTLVAKVFGKEFPVAREIIELPPMLVAEHVARSDGACDVRLVPLGAEVAEVMVDLVPLSELEQGG